MRRPIDRDDIPAGLVEPEEVADYQRWVDYWNGLSDEDQAAELQMMADYASLAEPDTYDGSTGS